MRQAGALHGAAWCCQFPSVHMHYKGSPTVCRFLCVAGDACTAHGQFAHRQVGSEYSVLHAPHFMMGFKSGGVIIQALKGPLHSLKLISSSASQATSRHCYRQMKAQVTFERCTVCRIHCSCGSDGPLPAVTVIAVTSPRSLMASHAPEAQLLTYQVAQLVQGSDCRRACGH
jgi:hypothetical protein